MKQNHNLPFCIKTTTTLVQFGTGGDVHTFFLVIFQLIEKGILEDAYPLITTDLYRKCIHAGNVEEFEVQCKALFAHYQNIKTSDVDWEGMPYNRSIHDSPNGKLCYDFSLPYLSDVFERFKSTFEIQTESYEICNEKGYKFSPMYLCPTDVKLYQKYKRMTPEDFEAQADDPFWMREPFGEENVAILVLDGSKE